MFHDAYILYLIRWVYTTSLDVVLPQGRITDGQTSVDGHVILSNIYLLEHETCLAGVYLLFKCSASLLESKLSSAEKRICWVVLFLILVLVIAGIGKH